MNEKALHTLEYDKIVTLLEERASSAPGKALCRAITPLTDITRIEMLQEETAAAVGRIFAKGSISFGNTFDVNASLLRLQLGSALGIRELLQICKLLENASLVRAYGRKEREDQPDDVLTILFTGLVPIPSATNESRLCIVTEEEVSDNASSTLRHIRRNIRSACELM